MTQDLLIEIGTEELPPASLRSLEQALLLGITAQLAEQQIGHGATAAFCTPRRLAVLFSDVAARQPDRTLVRRGPAVSAAFSPDGLPSKALLGFARSCGVEPQALGRERTDKGEWVVFESVHAGQATVELIPGLVERSLAGLPIAKRMRWGTGEAEFVRPVHWVCLVFGEHVIGGQVLGVEAGGVTYGHRFHAPEALPIGLAADYPGLLRDRGFVEPCFATRRAAIRTQILEIAAKHGVAADLPDALLDEVTALVEWPRALFGSFDESFLEVPAEVLVETMEKNQKYFPVRGGDGRLRPNFVVVANVDSTRPDLVIQGNERVIRPRFADAKFFWEQGLKQPLESYFARLEGIVFQERLGSVADRSRRVAKLAQRIAEWTGTAAELVARAAMLAKCDLATTMVGEFPELQGVMGRYYALQSGEAPEVCAAIEEHYRPRFSGDALAASRCGRVLALADRLDLLVGAFGIGQKPTGAKDPYGLRRAAIASVRILVEVPLNLDLGVLLECAASGYEPGVLAPGAVGEVYDYILGRLEGYFGDQGIPADAVIAVTSLVRLSGNTVLGQLGLRIRAVQSFRRTAAGTALAAANKRIANIVPKTGSDAGIAAAPDQELFSEPAEFRLWTRVQGLEMAIEPLLRQGDFEAVLGRLADLREDVDAFFDSVMVMAPDPLVRENRLALLQRLQGLFLNIADVSLLQ